MSIKKKVRVAKIELSEVKKLMWKMHNTEQ